MRKAPREGMESPQEQYDQLLSRGIEAQEQYAALARRISQLYDEGRDDEAEGLSEANERLVDGMTHLLAQRVDLLRTIESLKTIEDVFPRVKRASREEQAEVDATEVIRAFNAGKIGVDDVRAAGRRMQADQSDELTDAEMEAFTAARAALALEMGYEEPSKEVGWFGVHRNRVKFSMRLSAFPNTFGITGDDRISKMGVTVGEGEEREQVLYFDRGWDVACTNPLVQKEIDRAIAIFG